MTDREIYCCDGFKQMMDLHHFQNNKEPWYDELITYGEPTPFQIITIEDYDVIGWIYMKYCPLCGTKISTNK